MGELWPSLKVLVGGGAWVYQDEGHATGWQRLRVCGTGRVHAWCPSEHLGDTYVVRCMRVPCMKLALHGNTPMNTVNLVLQPVADFPNMHMDFFCAHGQADMCVPTVT